MKLKHVFLLALSTVALSGCAANVDKTQASNLNNYSETVIRQSIVVGKSTKKDVLLLLGAPTTPKEFKTAHHWTYVSKVVDRRIYLVIPLIQDRDQLLLLEFNDAGVVTKMNYTEQ